MNLKGISIKGSGNQNLAPRRMPPEQQRPARRRVRREILNNRCGNGRKSFGLDVRRNRQEFRRGITAGLRPRSGRLSEDSSRQSWSGEGQERGAAKLSHEKTAEGSRFHYSANSKPFPHVQCAV